MQLRDAGGYVGEARRLVDRRLTLPPGYRLVWSGQVEAMQRAGRKLRLVVPITLAIIFGLRYTNFRSVAAIMAGLVPILWSQGKGADVMKRIAAPMVGGMLTSTVLTLVVILAIHSLWKEREVARAFDGQ